MADEPTPTEAAEADEELGPQTELASLVAALGGGPGDQLDSGSHNRPDGRPASEDRPPTASSG
jgi:hypothetical protein